MENSVTNVVQRVRRGNRSRPVFLIYQRLYAFVAGDGYLLFVIIQAFKHPALGGAGIIAESGHVVLTGPTDRKSVV
jgi:hypothetical protein